MLRWQTVACFSLLSDTKRARSCLLLSRSILCCCSTSLTATLDITDQPNHMEAIIEQDGLIEDTWTSDQDASDEDAAEVKEQEELLLGLQRSTATPHARIYHVASCTCNKGYRPSALFEGCLLDIVQSQVGYHLQHASEQDLHLSLRYEPPSPKFSMSCKDMVSYRLKLLQGGSNNFIYSKRGLPKVILLDEQALAVGWGPLQLVFSNSTQLNDFLNVIRHVEVTKQQLWPQHIAALWLDRNPSSASTAFVPLEADDIQPPQAYHSHSQKLPSNGYHGAQEPEIQPIEPVGGTSSNSATIQSGYMTWRQDFVRHSQETADWTWQWLRKNNVALGSAVVALAAVGAMVCLRRKV